MQDMYTAHVKGMVRDVSWYCKYPNFMCFLKVCKKLYLDNYTGASHAQRRRQ